MSTGPNTACKIINNSGGPIVVLNAFNSSTNVASNSTKQGYLQELKALPFDGGTNTVLQSGATGTVTLNGTYVDSKGQTRTAYIYQLLISKPDSLFPVMAVGESLDFPSQSYPDITVTSDAAKNMATALTFCRNIMTAPTSKMAQTFQSTMTDAFSKGSLTESEQAVASFFNQYDAFKGLDFPSYVAVSTWLKAFAYLWGMGDAGTVGVTYYVYSANTSSSSSSDSGSGGSGVTSEGTIVVAAKAGAPSPADPADPNSGLTFTPGDGLGSGPLTYDQGQLIDSPGGAVALNGSFGYRGTFSGKSDDTTVIAIFTGTMLNKKVMAIPIAPETGWSKFWKGLTFQKLIQYFLTAMGIWMALDFIKTKLAGKENKESDTEANENEGDDLSDEQEQEAQEAGDEIGQDAAEANQQLADRVGAEPDAVPQDQQAFDNAVEQGRDAGADAYSDVAQDNIEGGIGEASAQLEDLAQLEMNQDIQDAYGNLESANESLSNGELADANSSLGEVTDALPQIVENMGDVVSDELKQQVDDSVEAQEEAAEVADETNESADDAGSGDEEPFEDGEIPEI